MLSVAKLTPGQETYYERSVAAGIDDYYAGRGESPGIWVGRAAAELGLAGSRRRRPAWSADPRRSPPTPASNCGGAIQRLARSPSSESTPSSGTRRLEEKTLRPVAGFDLVFSVPKSVSLLHALGDDQTRRVVNEAHAAAWQAALTYLEDEACVVRRGTGGTHPRARLGVRRGRLPAPHIESAGSSPAHPRDRGQHGAATERRQVARTGRRGDPEDLSARGGLPLPGAPPRGAVPVAGRRVGDAAQRDGRTARRLPRSHRRVLDTAGARWSSD